MFSACLFLQERKASQFGILTQLENRDVKKLQFSKQFKCPRCNKQYSSRSAVNIHMQNHTGKFTYYCEKCKKGYNYKTNYDVHMDKHAGIRYQCEFCTKSFAKTQDRDNHMSVHTGIWRMKCDSCGKGFNEKRLYERHIKCHP